MDMEVDGLAERQRGDPEAEREMVRLWRTVRTVHEMLSDRVRLGVSNVALRDLTVLGLRSLRRRTETTSRRLQTNLQRHARLSRVSQLSRSSHNEAFSNTNVLSLSRAKLKFAVKPSAEMNAKHTPLPTKANPSPMTTAGDCYVEFSPDGAIGIKHIRAFAQTLDSQNVSNGIFITQAPITAVAMRALEPLTARGISAEHFLESDLLVNITHHELVPKHVLMSAEEKKALLTRYRLQQHQLPRIQVNDPVARYLGLKRGNVVKIIRKSETAGRYASYRWCL